MKILIMSDIHSNLQALKEIFNYIETEEIKISQCVVLGDIVGYGPFPNECIQFLRNIPLCKVVTGNHEWGVARKIHLNRLNENAREAILWTRKVLGRGNYDFISGLPLTETLEYNDFKYLFLHGSPLNKIEEYILNNYIARQNFKAFNEDVCFFGHTHVPMLYLKYQDQVNSLYLNDRTVLKINKKYQYLINVGSVGQPRDGDTRASFGILDMKEKTLMIKRVEYNYKSTQKFIINAGLPDFLSRRLAYGR